MVGANADALPGSNPGGGGGPDPQTLQRFRAWGEGYGLASRMPARNDFLGDRRSTWGGVAGLGMTVAPGFQASLSVDQSRTAIRTPNVPAGADVDITQLGGGAFWENGPWSLAVAGVYGFGRVHSHRSDAGGAPSEASYDVRLWGALAELGYTWTFGQSRFTPKGGFDWTQSETDAFAESGGLAPITAGSQTSRRTRAFAGAEFGHTWILEKSLFDLAVTGKLIDNLSQSGGVLHVTSANGATTPIVVQGAREGRYGFDTTILASWILSSSTRIYALYDGRFHDGFTQQGGTIGLELKW
jgi:uncharacterized protein with beta-barrel porin domain